MLRELATAANELAERFKAEVSPTLRAPRGETHFDFEVNDASRTDSWATRGTVLLLNAPTMGEPTLAELAAKANSTAVRPETLALVVARPWAALDSDLWVLIAEDDITMSWGRTKVFVYEKISNKTEGTRAKTKNGAAGKKTKKNPATQGKSASNKGQNKKTAPSTANKRSNK